MPPAAVAIAGAALASFGLPALGIGVSSVLGYGAMTSFLIRAGVGLALGALSQANQPTPSAAGGYKVTSSGGTLDHQIIYGRRKVAGVRIYDDCTGTDNRYLHRIIAFAGHEIDSYDEIWINDTKVNAMDGNGFVTSIIDEDGATNSTRYASAVDPSLIRIKRYYGTVGQTADATLISESTPWTTNHKLSNIAYLYIRFKYSESAYPNGIPEITATIKGKKVYDPRLPGTAWSENPALCIRDYLKADYGLLCPDSEIDISLVTAAANVCDTIKDGRKQFTCNGAFTTASTPVDVLQSLLTSMAGQLWYSQGTWRMKPAYFTSSVLTLDEKDLRSTIDITTRNSRRDNFNTVNGTWCGELSNWEPTSFKVVTDAAYVTVDGGETSAIDLDLPFTGVHETARHVSNLILRQNREQLSISATFGLRAFAVEVGDVISLTVARAGWSAKLFEVVNWSFSVSPDMTLEVSLDLKETSTAVYNTDAAAATFENNNTNLPKPFLNLAPTGLTFTNIGLLGLDGAFINSAQVSWTAPSDDFVVGYDVEWKITSDSVYESIYTSSTRYQIKSVKDSTSYNVRVRGINSFGAKGPYVSGTFTAGVDTTAPSAPSSMSATAKAEKIVVQWVNPTNVDFAKVDVYRNTTNNSGTATKIASLDGTKYTDNTLSRGDVRYYWTKAVDYTGNASAFSAVASATAGGVATGAIDPNAVTMPVKTKKNTKYNISSTTTWTTLAKLGIARVQGFTTEFYVSMAVAGYGTAVLEVGIFRDTTLIETRPHTTPERGSACQMTYIGTDSNTASGTVTYHLKVRRSSAGERSGFSANLDVNNIYFQVNQVKR